MNIINFLKGKKTYIVGIAAVILGAIINSPELVAIGLGFMGLRAGIAKGK